MKNKGFHIDEMNCEIAYINILSITKPSTRIKITLADSDTEMEHHERNTFCTHHNKEETTW